MDDAPFAEKIQGRAGRVALATMALRSSKEQSRSWSHIFGFQSGLVKLYVKKMADFTLRHQPPKKHKSVNSAWFHDLVSI